MPQFPQHEKPKPEDYDKEMFDLVGILAKLITSCEEQFTNRVNFNDNNEGFKLEQGEFYERDFPLTFKKPDRFKKKAEHCIISQIYNVDNPTEDIASAVFLQWNEDGNGIRVRLVGLDPDIKYFLRLRVE